MFLTFIAGATSQYVDIFVGDSSSTTGAGLSGLAYNSGSLTCYYHRDSANSSTSVALASGTLGTWATGMFKEVDATNMPGWYQFGIPNAALASSAKEVNFLFKGASNMVPTPLKIRLSAVNPDDNVRMGMTALPNVVSGAGAGQLATVNRNSQIQLDTAGKVFTPYQYQTSVAVTTSGSIGGYTVTASGLNSAGADNALKGWTVQVGLELRTVVAWTDATRTITIDRPWLVNHPLTDFVTLWAFPNPALSATLAVTSAAVSDKTGYSLSQAFPSNFGSLSIDSLGRVTPSGNVTVGTNLDKSGYSLSQNFPSNFANLAIDSIGRVSPSGSVTLQSGEYTNIATQVLSTVVTAPTGAPAAPYTLDKVLGWLLAKAKFKRTQTASTETIYNDAGTSSIATQSTSDDGTTFTKDKAV